MVRVRNDSRSKAGILVDGQDLHVLTQQKQKTLKFPNILTPGTQDEVFEKVTSIVADACEGFNCGILCYGASGCGKTYTMTGTEANPGIIFKSFVLIREKGIETEVRYMEVYQNKVYDIMTLNRKPLLVTYIAARAQS